MEEKKKKVNNTTITRNTADFSRMTDNIYETVAVLTKRANQIAAEEKKELHNKIDEFKGGGDSLDEMFENREQVEIVRRFEMQPKPSLEATEEYLEGNIFYRNPAKEDQKKKHLEALEEEVIKEM
ncbi:MAG: DNA-directed RNA polymerase subunit omega [Bacteroidales bacterium]|nr:DNA-directed RNA polymerase subunit omega [Bacteroidales bacterium]MBR5092165.1 DNA-directed RNA polymerase subunit omega [Bacteroidales bacterium]